MIAPPSHDLGSRYEPSVCSSFVRLTQASCHSPLRTVGCDYRAGVLELHGCVPTYYLKQLAQTFASSIEGVERVVNYVRVIKPAGR